MNKKKYTYRLIFTVVLFSLFLTGNISGQNTILVEYTLNTSVASTNGTAVNHPGGIFSTSALSLGFSGSVAQTSGWDSGTGGGYKFWQTASFSTTGYQSIKASAALYSSSNTGPKDFALEYKIGAGAWTPAGDITVTSSETNYDVFLPSECRNQSDLSVRWIARSYTNLNGLSVVPFAKSYIKNVSIVGALLTTTPPTTQAKNITFTSLTPTTITVGCTSGSGDHRLIVANKTNAVAFNPTDGTIYTANPLYSTANQIVYNGTGSNVVVTVPNSKEDYYFRVYDYNLIDGSTYYLTSTATNNPKFCALEDITANSPSNIKLISGTLGATIKIPTKSGITDRGIIWKTSPGVTDGDNLFSDYGNDGGSFSLNFPDGGYGTNEFPRSSTIYYKGYVTNESGTILSPETSFSNAPIFTGTGNWESPNNWNVQQVPGSGTTFGSILDKPIINGNCALSSTTSCTNITINSGKKLTISPTAFLTVASTITNDAGNSGILIKSSETNPNGSLIFNNSAGNPVSATVEMYSKAKWDLTKPLGSKYSWQYFGIPVKSFSLTPIFTGAYVRKWEESGQTDADLWVIQNTSATLTSTTGYELVQSTAKTYTFAGQLDNQGFTRSLPYTSGAVYPGQHIFGNPFTAAIDIEKIQFGANTEKSVYLYNTGTFNEWDNNSGQTETGEGHGQYTVTTPKAAGGLGIPSQIPSMQGFLVKSTTATGSITIPYNTSVANSAMQRTKANNEIINSEKVITRIDIKSTHYLDRMWIFTNPECTRSFDNGWDGPKMLGSTQRTQLFSMEEDGNYQINAIRNINDTYLGFQPGDDEEFNLTFIHQNIESAYTGIYLIDLLENKTLNVTASGSEYSFTSQPSIAISKRFKIVTKTTSTNINKEEQFQIFHKNSEISVQNFSENNGILNIYSISGVVFKKITFNANSVTSFSTTDLPKGVYVAKAFVNKKELTLRIIVR